MLLFIAAHGGVTESLLRQFSLSVDSIVFYCLLV